MTALVHSGCQSKKYHGVVGLNDRNPMFAVLGAEKSKVKVAVPLAFLEDLLPGLQMVLFSSCCHPVASRERGSLLLEVLSSLGDHPLLRNTGQLPVWEEGSFPGSGCSHHATCSCK